MPKLEKIVYNKVELSLFERICMIFKTRDKDKLEYLLKGDEEIMNLRKAIEDISSNEDLYEKYTKSELENIVEAELMAKDMAKDMAKEKAKDMALKMLKDNIEIDLYINIYNKIYNKHRKHKNKYIIHTKI